MRAVRRRLSQSTEAQVYEDVLSTIRSMHDCSSLSEYQTLCASAIQRWPEVVSQYMQNQWLEGPCSRWQLFRGRPDCPHSNQGQESFNRLLKDHFTLRRRCKMSECLDALCRASQYIARRILEENGQVIVSPGEFVFRNGGPSETGLAPTQTRF